MDRIQDLAKKFDIFHRMGRIRQVYANTRAESRLRSYCVYSFLYCHHIRHTRNTTFSAQRETLTAESPQALDCDDEENSIEEELSELDGHIGFEDDEDTLTNTSDGRDDCLWNMS